ncbi:MAG: AfsR/SARP family transcriptional regulator [Candidatus Promineifilaceae bacterium]
MLPIDRRHAIALLAYLSITGQPHSRTALAELLWAETEVKTGLTYLRRILHLLKKILPTGVLLINRTTIQFASTQQIEVDALLFEQRLRDRDLVTAVQVYRGEFLDGLNINDRFDIWKQVQAERFRQQMLQAYRQLTTLHAAAGQIEETIQHAQNWLSLDPLEESAHHVLIQLLLASGRTREAQLQYATCRDMLARELQVEPSIELQQLLQTARSAPRLQSGGVRKRHNNLPPMLLPFFGRNGEIQLITHQLAQPTTRLVSLIGMGGIGKTALALQIGRALVNTYADGILLVDLSIGATSLYDAILHASEQRLFGGMSPAEQVTHYLREKQILLLLDNFETNLGLVAQLSDLIRATRRCDFLITSRQRLMLQEEWLISLDGLLANAAAQLFNERARQLAGFVVENDAKVLHICETVANIPLAIELAATWTRVLSLDEIATEIRRSLNFLQTPYANMNKRHISIRAVMQQSWDQLAAFQQQLFCQLSVFAGAFDRAAFYAVTQARLMVLIGLIDRSLVQRLDANTFQLNNVLRQYAADQLCKSPIEKAETTARHGDYYMRMLAEQASGLLGPKPQRAARLIAANEANVLKAWRWTVSQSARTLSLECVLALSEYFEIRGRFYDAVALFGDSAEKYPPNNLMCHWLGAYQACHLSRCGENQRAADWLERHVHLVDASANPALHAFILWQLSYTKLQLGEFDKAEIQLALSAELSQQQNDLPALARVYNRLGIINAMRGRYELAQDNFKISIGYSTQAQYVRYRTLTLHNLGNVLCSIGQVVEGRQLFESSLAFSEQLDDLYGVANVTHNLAELALRNHEFTKAQRLYARGHALHTDIGHRYGILKGFLGMARAFLGLGQFKQARTHLNACLKLAIETRTQPLVADALYWLAQVSAAQANWGTTLEIGSYIQTQNSLRDELREPLQALLTQSRIELASNSAKFEQRGVEQVPSYWLPLI